MNDRQGGFTLIEVILVAALLAMVLAMIASSMTTATRSLRVDDRIALSMESLQRSAVRISQIMRPCAISTYRVLSAAEDVPTFAASVGEWMEPIADSDVPSGHGATRPSVQFRAATGELSLNASALTSERVLRLELDSGEIANGVDDDGDNMIDEGRVILEYDGVPVALAANIEAITFTLVGRLVTIELRSAAVGNDGRMHRFVATEVLYLRNN